jgi:eukaryotic-like serine/threonine-protein kinase
MYYDAFAPGALGIRSQHPCFDMVGRTISHYSVLEEIGAGGMGVVYRAHDERLDRDVALKVLSPELSGDQEFLARFRREARLLSKLNHPNVATVHDFDAEGGISFIVMELVQGKSLTEKIRKGPLGEGELVRVAIQLLDGLCAAHAEGIIHRDLKPGNLRETLDGRLKILDFGLARTMQVDMDVTQSIATTSGVVGTLPYMAPEQLRGEYIDARTDIYATGVVLYELATGSRPFPETFGPRLTDSILHRIPPSAREVNPKVSLEFDSLIRIALEKEPQRRFGTAREMLDAVERIRTNALVDALGHVAARPAPRDKGSAAAEGEETPLAAPRKTAFAVRWKVWIAVAGVLLATVLGLGLWAFGGRFLGKVKPRPTVAVLGFKNQTGAPETDWVSTSLSDMLASELAAGDHIVPIPAETVARMKIDLALPNEASYSADTIEKVRRSLRCDYVVSGALFSTGESAGGRIQLTLQLQRARNGEVIQRITDYGTELALPELATTVGSTLRAKLGLPGISVSQSSELQAAVPSTPDAARLYFEGLAKLRTFDLLGARDSLLKATIADPNFSLAHAYLAAAWSQLGYDEKAKQEAKRAFELSSRLGREDKTLVEARFREISSDWDKATDLYRSLWTLYPENPEYGVRAADVQIRAGRANEALKTVEELRKQPESIRQDALLDLKEAEAAEALSDFSTEKQAALRAADGARAKGSRLLEAEALWRACAAMAMQGDAQGAQSACQQSIGLSRPTTDLLLVARAYTILGLIAGTQGDPKQSLEQHRQALDFAHKIGSKRDIAGALTNIGNVLANQGDFAEAQKTYESALSVAQEINDRGQTLNLLNNLATVSQSLGKFSVALGLYQRSLEEARSVQDKGSIARAQNNIAFIYWLQGNFSPALQNFQEALKAAEETGNKSDQARFLYGLGDINLDQAQLTRAEENYQNGLKLATQIGDKTAIALGQLSLGQLRLQDGKAEEAKVLAKQAADEFRLEGLKDTEALARSRVASALLDLDRKEEAEKELELVEKSSLQDPTIRLAIAITSGRLQMRSGKMAAGKTKLEDVASEARKLGVPGLQFEARLAQGESGLFGGDRRAALLALSALQKDAAKKGFKQIEARAVGFSQQINSSKPG